MNLFAAFLDLFNAGEYTRRDNWEKGIEDRVRALECTIDELRDNPTGLSPDILAKKKEHEIQMSINRHMAEAERRRKSSEA